MDGGAGNDRIRGGAGRDSMSGGGGTNRLWGGKGDDYLNSANGKKDYVYCGPGNDNWQGDMDLDVVVNCEYSTA